jgi:hypothetical protein
MKDKVLVSVNEIMIHHQLDEAFINKVENYQLVSFVIKNSQKFIIADEMPRMEKIIRLHYDLDINMEGIEVIKNMLDRMEALQDEVRKLQNRLNIYE